MEKRLSFEFFMTKKYLFRKLHNQNCSKRQQELLCTCTVGGFRTDETTHGHIGQLDSQLLQAKKVIDKKIIGQTATGN